jgi:hypothetical protein
MGVETTTSLTITCDNPDCPGNSLDPASYEGWTQLQASVYGEMAGADVPFPMPFVSTAYYCSPECAGTVGTALAAAEEARNAPPELAVDDPDDEA